MVGDFKTLILRQIHSNHTYVTNSSCNANGEQQIIIISNPHLSRFSFPSPVNTEEGRKQIFLSSSMLPLSPNHNPLLLLLLSSQCIPSRRLPTPTNTTAAPLPSTTAATPPVTPHPTASGPAAHAAAAGASAAAAVSSFSSSSSRSSYLSPSP